MTLLAAAIDLGQAISNTIVGLGTVFLILAFLVLLISMFKYVNAWTGGNEKKAPAEAPKAAPTPASAPAPAVPAGPGTMASAKVTISDEVEGPVAAAILAAAAEISGGTFRVTSIKKHQA